MTHCSLAFASAITFPIYFLSEVRDFAIGEGAVFPLQVQLPLDFVHVEQLLVRLSRNL